MVSASQKFFFEQPDLAEREKERFENRDSGSFLSLTLKPRLAQQNELSYVVGVAGTEISYRQDLDGGV